MVHLLVNGRKKLIYQLLRYKITFVFYSSSLFVRGIYKWGFMRLLRKRYPCFSPVGAGRYDNWNNYIDYYFWDLIFVCEVCFCARRPRLEKPTKDGGCFGWGNGLDVDYWLVLLRNKNT